MEVALHWLPFPLFIPNQLESGDLNPIQTMFSSLPFCSFFFLVKFWFLSLYICFTSLSCCKKNLWPTRPVPEHTAWIQNAVVAVLVEGASHSVPYRRTFSALHLQVFSLQMKRLTTTAIRPGAVFLSADCHASADSQKRVFWPVWLLILFLSVSIHSLVPLGSEGHYSQWNLDFFSNSLSERPTSVQMGCLSFIITLLQQHNTFCSTILVK